MSAKTTLGFCLQTSERECKVLIPPLHVHAGTASSIGTIRSATFFFQLKGINNASKNGTLSVLWAHLTAWESQYIFLCSTSGADALMQAKGSKERISFAWAAIAEKGWSELELSLARNTALGSSPLRPLSLAGLEEGSNPRSGERKKKKGEASV